MQHIRHTMCALSHLSAPYRRCVSISCARAGGCWVLADWRPPPCSEGRVGKGLLAAPPAPPAEAARWVTAQLQLLPQHHFLQPLPPARGPAALSAGHGCEPPAMPGAPSCFLGSSCPHGAVRLSGCSQLSGRRCQGQEFACRGAGELARHGGTACPRGSLVLTATRRSQEAPRRFQLLPHEGEGGEGRAVPPPAAPARSRRRCRARRSSRRRHGAAEVLGHGSEPRQARLRSWARPHGQAPGLFLSLLFSS